MKILEAKIIQERKADLFEEEVENYSRKGFEPLGGMQLSDLMFTIMMVKYDIDINERDTEHPEPRD